MLLAKGVFGTTAEPVFPNNLIPKILLAKHLVHQDLDIVADVPVQMHINAGGVRHDALDRHQVFVHPVQVVFLLPYIAVQGLLEGL